MALSLAKHSSMGLKSGLEGRQEPQRRARGFDGRPHPVDLMGGQIVGDHDVAGLEGGDQDLLDVGEEARAIHGAVEHAGGGEPRHTEPGNERTRLPVSVRRVIGHALAPETPPVAAQEIGGDAAFVEKDEAGRVKRGGDGDVRPVLFGGAHRFF